MRTLARVRAWLSLNRLYLLLAIRNRCCQHRCPTLAASDTLPLARLLLLWTAVAVLANEAHAAETFPYTAYVVDDDTPVQSGPGSSYYATARLAAGAELQVHRRDPGGWLAIRPPEQSFSWVPTRKVWRTDEANVVEVIGDDACAWLGSGVETVTEHKWQVRLHRGELLEVLGEREVRDAAAGTTERWYKIAPPAGEFRWIHDRLVSRERAEWTLERDRPPARADDVTDATQNQVRSAAFLAPDRSTASTKSTRSAKNDTKKTERSPVRGVTRLDTAASRVEPDDVRQLDAAHTAAESAPTPATRAADDVTSIDIDLSQAVARDPSTWNLTPLHERAERLIARGATPLDRGRARLLLEKIEQFEDLHRRHVEAERPVTVAKNNSPSTTSSPAIPATPATRSSDPAAIEPRFDGVGTLMPVHSTKRVAPPFALMNEDGKVLQYVAPAPGLNLHRYTNKRIGVYGQRATAGSLNAPVLTAQRIVELDRQRN